MVARYTCSDNVLPVCLAIKTARYDVIKGELLGRESMAAILTGKRVPHEDIETRESRAFHGHGLVLLEGNYAWQWKYHAGGTDADVIGCYDGHSVEEYGFNNVLPGPQGKWHVA